MVDGDRRIVHIPTVHCGASTRNADPPRARPQAKDWMISVSQVAGSGSSPAGTTSHPRPDCAGSTDCQGLSWTPTDHAEAAVAARMRSRAGPREVTLVLNNSPCTRHRFGCDNILRVQRRRTRRHAGRNRHSRYAGVGRHHPPDELHKNSSPWDNPPGSALEIELGHPDRAFVVWVAPTRRSPPPRPPGRGRMTPRTSRSTTATPWTSGRGTGAVCPPGTSNGHGRSDLPRPAAARCSPRGA
jgi:hypothetical protein